MGHSRLSTLVGVGGRERSGREREGEREGGKGESEGKRENEVIDIFFFSSPFYYYYHLHPFLGGLSSFIIYLKWIRISLNGE